MNDSYSDHARTAILGAINEEHDFGGWLAAVLSNVAADLGSSDALTAGAAGLVGGRARTTAGERDRRLGRRLPG